jgi:manganese/zinc/iron transport system substrate-binding protein
MKHFAQPKKNNSKLRFLCLILIFLIFVSCSPSEQTEVPLSPDKSLQIVATTGMIADMVKLMGGSHVKVEQLISHGVDPHLYRPTRDDVLKISRADLVFYNGLLLEGRMSEVLGAKKFEEKAYPVTSFISQTRYVSDPASEDTFDPHLWMDVSLWREIIFPVAELLSSKIPEAKEDIAEHAKSLDLELNKLHEYGVQTINKIPEDKRVLITSHDAFQYFGKAYGMTVHGVQGVSTESEAGIKRINSLSNLIVEKQISAVFVESSVSPKTIEALIEGVQSQGYPVRKGGILYTDAMGAEGTVEGTYKGMMEHNFNTIFESLTRDASHE